MKDDWYIAIMRFGTRSYPFFAVGSNYYRDFKDLATQGSMEVVAEAFDVPGEVVDRISENGLARNIADRLENGELFDAQKELENIVKE